MSIGQSTPLIVSQDELRTAVEAAGLAPSLHNAQPWWFHVRPDGIEVHADRSRNLAVVDPIDRELHIGCGAAIALARVALRGMGWSVDTNVLPDDGEHDLLAVLTVTGRQPATGAEKQLVQALPIRYTDRGRYADRPLPAALIEEFRAAVESEGVWLRPLDRPGDEVVAAVLLGHADELERADLAYVAELASWSRYDSAAVDGVPRQAVDSTPVEARGSTIPLRNFDVDGSVTAGYVPSEDPPPAEHPLFVVIGTESDGRQSWLEAGMALGQLLLRAAANGVSAAPMTQVLEIPAARLRLGHALGTVGHPQMLLRMGYGTGRPTTHRRPVDDVIR
ncbi:MAG: hypothetical protein QOG53_2597 [Frankiales bacterium]|jgi:nitroreductase|nr:hypothetical protein [Frankiales bacterium]